MAAPFNPPDHSSKPAIPSWTPPPKPTEDLDYAKLHTIELALVDSPDPAVRSKLIEIAKEAIRDDGFLYLTNYGVSLDQVCTPQDIVRAVLIDQLHRQFSIAHYLHRNISEEDKDRLHWDPQGGLYAGYKPPFGWRVGPIPPMI
jgi:hypothetical protein